MCNRNNTSKVSLPLVMWQWDKLKVIWLCLFERTYWPYLILHLKTTPYQDMWLRSEPSVQCGPSIQCERSVRHRGRFVSADLYYLSKLNQTNRERAGIPVAALGTERRKKKPKTVSFSQQKEWLGGGRKTSRNELRRDRLAAGTLRAEVVTFLSFLQVYLSFSVDTSCFAHSICLLSFAVYLWQVCWTTHAKPLKCFLLNILRKKLILSWSQRKVLKDHQRFRRQLMWTFHTFKYKW